MKEEIEQNYGIERKKEKEEVDLMSPLVWAYIGDGVYELFIRMHFVNHTKLNAHKLHIETVQYVKAKAQAELLKKIQAELTEEEKEIVRRGRNAENHHLPKNTELADYRYATAFEALIGYLYLTKQDARLTAVLRLAVGDSPFCP